MVKQLALAVNEARSLGAGKINEDAYGHGAQAMWLLDGASGVSETTSTPGPTDAAWLSHWAAEYISQTVSRHDKLNLLLAEMEVALRGQFSQFCNYADTDDHDMPTTCLAIARFDPHTSWLHVACVGDISVLLMRPDGFVIRYSDEAAAPFGELTLRALSSSRLAGDDPNAQWQSARTVILENRRMVNQSDGYWVLHPRRSCLPGVKYFGLPVDVNTRLLMASDGLYRLVDVYKLMDDKQFILEAFARGADGILKYLRTIEALDPACKTFNRVKVSDDATIILATVEDIVDS